MCKRCLTAFPKCPSKAKSYSLSMLTVKLLGVFCKLIKKDINRKELRAIFRCKIFFKCAEKLLLVLPFFAIALVSIYYKWYIILSIILIIVYFIITHIYIESTMVTLWRYLGYKRNPHKLTATLGVIDRIIYAMCYTLGALPVIGIWFGIKIATRLVSYSNINREPAFRSDGQRKNVYLFGNAISLLLGISVGFCIKSLFNTYNPLLLASFVKILKDGLTI